MTYYSFSYFLWFWNLGQDWVRQIHGTLRMKIGSKLEVNLNPQTSEYRLLIFQVTSLWNLVQITFWAMWKFKNRRCRFITPPACVVRLFNVLNLMAFLCLFTCYVLSKYLEFKVREICLNQLWKIVVKWMLILFRSMIFVRFAFQVQSSDFLFSSPWR